MINGLNLNVEYRHENGFKNFFAKISGKTVAVLYDVNTKKYALPIICEMQNNNAKIISVYYQDEELVPTEDKCDYAFDLIKDANYVLAVGSGTLNDMAKSVATKRGIPCGVLPTAPSMDGYCSKGSALMRGGLKVTDTVYMPKDVLIDLEIIKNAPKIMIGAGFGDIIGKYTCLLDWQLSNAVNGESINQEAFSMMESAKEECINAFEGLVNYEGEAIAKLMNALIIAGTSMAICGNSRPASGSEHHQSHFLEMDFVRRGEKIPMHGLKVAIGTLVSIELYNYLKNNNITFTNCEKVYKLVQNLPSEKAVENMLLKMGCPVRFSHLGVRRETMEEMIENAYTVRDRYTVLTLIHDLGLTNEIKPLIMDKYY